MLGCAIAFSLISRAHWTRLRALMNAVY